MRNPGLPDGTDVHDSDPVEQKPLVGTLIAEVTLAMSCEIRRMDYCMTEAQAVRAMESRLTILFDTEDFADLVEIDIRPITFESD